MYLCVSMFQRVNCLCNFIFTIFQSVFAVVIIAGCVAGDARRSPAAHNRAADDDESIQAFVFERAKRFGYGLRIIPRVKELLFGKPPSSKSKHSSKTVSNSNSISSVREKRKLIDFRRPSRETAHVKKNQKYSPRNNFHSHE